MKILAIAATLAFVVGPAFGSEYVHGYFRSNGTYVQPYYRSSPDNTATDNYSFMGNTNPYTGSTGDDYYRHDETSPYFDGTPYGDGSFGHSGAVYGY